MHLFVLIAIVINSTQRINKYGDNGHCRTHLVILKKNVECPLLITHIVISAYMMWTYCGNLFPNPNGSNILSKYIHSTVSKDFPKSTSRIINFNFCIFNKIYNSSTIFSDITIFNML